ncbi:UPF0400 protein C337.03 isoform X2 [Neltuma alba]|uniref:UPF0400 protein C337.03 isoform X2 n=1 Tax=Neltuma alba TaxID=207710 RepID=UPI0010A345A8|nr:UPF0400 protein C337.03-like isoform X2 [Prosopis alba]
MGSTFNPQILVEKLAKLNSSQASIETLSHWCIFHMNKANQVVETWDRQFHCSPREQRLAFLYLANDILQNSRRKGSEFVGEFWRVLPDALRDVINNGDEFGRNAALRLIGIWEERKVFGSRGQILKEEFIGRHVDNSSRNGKSMPLKLRPSAGNTLEKLVSGYQAVYGGHADEDAILSKCRNAINCLEKVDKENGQESTSGKIHGSTLEDELRGHDTVLRDCIEQLTAIESSRASLVSYLREALQDQEFKLDQVRNQIQAARVQSERVGNTCQQSLNDNNIQQSLAAQNSKEIQTSLTPPGFIPGDKEQSAPLMYTQQVSYPQKSGHIEEDTRKSAAAAVAAKLTASTSSAQMLSYVLSSLASEGVIGNSIKESSGGDYHPEKRTKLDNDQSSYVPSHNPQQPLPPFSLSESLHNASTTNQQSTVSDLPPPPSSSPPPMPPLPPVPQYQVPQFMQTAGSINNVAYSYSLTQQPSMAAYPTVGASLSSISPYTPAPVGTYQGFQGSDGNYYNQPSSMPMAPISRR